MDLVFPVKHLNMGLDSVEILMKVEDTFGIKISVRDAGKIFTVGDFHEAVWKLLPDKYSEKCKSQMMFYKLRKGFVRTFNSPPDQFGLDASPEQIFPKADRPRVYQDFANNMDLDLPTLKLSKHWQIFLTAFAVLVVPGALTAAIILIIFFNISKWVLFIPVGGVLLTLLLSSLLEPKRLLISAPTIRVFTEQVLALNYASFVTTVAQTERKWKW